MPSDLTLGFDTSAAHCAAALLRGDEIIASRHEEMGKGQAERLFPLLEELLAGAGASWGELSRIGVGIGPGNFTGIRIAVAAARGLALSLGIPAAGVSTFEALRFGAHGAAVTSIDARQNRLYIEVPGAQPMLVEGNRLPPLPPGALCIGHDAERLAALCNGHAAAPTHPIAEAIARITRNRRDFPRPAPLYLRAADAAPARDSGPVMLPS